MYVPILYILFWLICRGILMLTFVKYCPLMTGSSTMVSGLDWVPPRPTWPTCPAAPSSNPTLNLLLQSINQLNVKRGVKLYKNYRTIYQKAYYNNERTY